MDNTYKLAQNILTESCSLKSFKSVELYGNTVEDDKEHKSSGDITYRLENESGTGSITLYNVFPGIELIYNDIHMSYCNKEQKSVPNVIEINYCKEGRCECEFGDRQYCYMSAGDLSFCSLQDNTHVSEFPTSHYHGITVTVDFSSLSDDMKSILNQLDVDLSRIKSLVNADKFTIIRANQTIKHIFSELYTIPNSVKHGYIRVKTLELLLVLSTLEPNTEPADKNYYQLSQIETIKKIHAFLKEHYSERYTINELSQSFNISQTILKRCFKAVYGDSLYAYMKIYRLQKAEQLLRETNLSVSEIAAEIGYLNPNKFTSAFTAEYGLSPTAYRKNV